MERVMQKSIAESENRGQQDAPVVSGPMLYRAYLDGFTGHFASVSELKVWAEGMCRRYSLTGKTCVIHRAIWTAHDGSAAHYSAEPTRCVVVGA